MARHASSQPDSGSPSTATTGFDMDRLSFGIRHSGFVISPARRLAIRGIEADIGKEHADTFRNVQHPDLSADYVLANPPFNDSDWFLEDDDVRWQPSGARSTAKGSPQGERGGVYQFGVPPKGNANFAWVQHFIHHLAPQGMAG